MGFLIRLGRFGVGLFVDATEFFDGIVHIHLRSRKVGMTEQFFDCVQVGAVVGKMGGKRMTQHVRAMLMRRCKQRKIFFDDTIDLLIGGGLAGFGME